MNPWLLVGFLLAVSASYGVGHFRGDSAGQAFVKQQWDQEKTKQLAEHAENMRLAREKEQLLQAGADKLREESNEKTRELNSRAASIADSLRQRPTRAAAEASAVSGATGTTCPTTVCVAGKLVREDAEALISIGKQAEELRISLNQCVTQYQSLRQ